MCIMHKNAYLKTKVIISSKTKYLSSAPFWITSLQNYVCGKRIFSQCMSLVSNYKDYQANRHPPPQGNRARRRKRASRNLTSLTRATFENRILYQTFDFFPVNRKESQYNNKNSEEREQSEDEDSIVGAYYLKERNFCGN